MHDVYYFGAGPTVLPKVVLRKIQSELLNYGETGLSILEISHRSDEFLSIKDSAAKLLRELLCIPSDYEILFMHGGATSQYSMLPLNFLGENKSANYICTGHWSLKASNEAERLAKINKINAIETAPNIKIVPTEKLVLDPNAIYTHYCDNETISGVSFSNIPEVSDNSLVCDMTSSILSKPIDVSRFAIIYASAQKNLGIAGLGVVIIKKSFLERVNSCVPKLYDYEICYDRQSLVNTPPNFAIYTLKLMLEWVKSEGGVKEMNIRSERNAELVYKIIDNSRIYENKVGKLNRSKINITFEINDSELQRKFLLHAHEKNLLGLRGHNSVGGIRASLYNAQSSKAIKKLIDFMQEFEIHG